MSDQDFETQVSRVSLLAEPVRRALYDYVASASGAVGRVEAAEATGVPSHTAKFHLDKLVEEGLLATEYRRLSGRSGPGAGRPAKLYRRTDQQIEVSLPARRYELAGQVLADGIARAAATGAPVLDAVAAAATEAGHALGEDASARTNESDDDLDQVAAALAPHGFEPHHDGDAVVLGNCPFHALVAQHTDLVCTMNLALLQGLTGALDVPEALPHLEPPAAGERRCCVVVRRRAG